jgi:branched-chain amino acid transport system ATP-binding protein
MLDVANVSVSFGGLAALNDVSFRIGSNEVASVIGPNGAGKTTLFNVITGFQNPTRGQVSFLDQGISGMVPNRIARLGVVRTFQKTEVFPGLTLLQCVQMGALCHRQFSVWQVLRGGPPVRDFERQASARALELLDFVGLAGKERQTAQALSYGEQRLLEVAVCLAAEPRLLLLDEPASGMNPEEADRMGRLIARLRDNSISVVLVEHNMALVMDISDRIIVLHHGAKIAEGAPEEIASNREVVEAYLGMGWSDAQG